MAVVTDADGGVQIRVMDVLRGETRDSMIELLEGGQDVASLDAHGREHGLVYATIGGEIARWRVGAPVPQLVATVNPDDVLTAFAGGVGLLVVTMQGVLRMLRWGDRETAWSLEIGAVAYPAVSCDRRFILIPWAEGLPARLVAAEDGEVVARMEPPSTVGRVRAFGAVSADGSLCAMGRGGGGVWIWSPKSNELMEYPVGGTEEEHGVQALEFVGNGTVLCVLRARGLELMDAARGARISLHPFPDAWQACGIGPWQRLRASPAGRRVALCGRGHGLQVVEVRLPPVADRASASGRSTLRSASCGAGQLPEHGEPPSPGQPSGRPPATGAPR